MVKFILLIFGCIVFVFLANLINLARCAMLNIKINRAIEKDNIETLIFHRNTFLSLTGKAYVHDKIYVKEFGHYGSNYAQMTNARTEFPYHNSLHQSQNMLIESAGYYWNKALGSLFPPNWIKVAFLLPSYILSYIGINKSNIFTKISNVIWWFLCVAWWLFEPQFESLRELVNNFIKDLF